jgi:serine/threonine-protein kinase
VSASSEPDLSGQRIGEYQLLRPLGYGGMGVVYEGVQPLIGKRVAVKVLRPQFSGDTELVMRFLAEARAVNSIRHRGIVDIFSFGQLPEGSHYFVMELLQGKPFDLLIHDKSPLPSPNVLEWAEEVLDALDAAHSTRVIHRDIKPSNLFLVDEGRGRAYVKLLDFGIAKLHDRGGARMTRESEVLGTPEYMSPEQARGETITPSTDLYAFGCVLYEMLTGRCPFEGDTPTDTMLMHLKHVPPPPSRIEGSIPAEVDELVGWALKKNQTERPTNAREMRQFVQALQRVYPVERTEASLPPRLASSAPRVPQRSPPAAPPRVALGSVEVEPTVLNNPPAVTLEDDVTRIRRSAPKVPPEAASRAEAVSASRAATYDEAPAHRPTPQGRAPTREAQAVDVTDPVMRVPLPVKTVIEPPGSVHHPPGAPEITVRHMNALGDPSATAEDLEPITGPVQEQHTESGPVPVQAPVKTVRVGEGNGLLIGVIVFLVVVLLGLGMVLALRGAPRGNGHLPDLPRYDAPAPKHR